MADYQWMGSELPIFVTHLECSMTGEHYRADTLQTLSRAEGRCWCATTSTRCAEPLAETGFQSSQNLWRYRELLPVRRPENVLSLGEVTTPLVPLPRRPRAAKSWSRRGPVSHWIVQGARAGACRVMAKELGVKTMAMPTNGNAGAAMAAYCARAGINPMSSAPMTPRR